MNRRYFLKAAIAVAVAAQIPSCVRSSPCKMPEQSYYDPGPDNIIARSAPPKTGDLWHNPRTLETQWFDGYEWRSCP